MISPDTKWEKNEIIWAPRYIAGGLDRRNPREPLLKIMESDVFHLYMDYIADAYFHFIRERELIYFGWEKHHHIEIHQQFVWEVTPPGTDPDSVEYAAEWLYVKSFTPDAPPDQRGCHITPDGLFDYFNSCVPKYRDELQQIFTLLLMNVREED